jgi:ABC-type Fe3+-hydroxamate transport system substrate-binding protein
MSPRVVSLVPSVTETLLSWGVVPVGVTRFCEHPELPAMGGTKNPDLGRIVDARPDLVILDREENRRPDAEALAAAGLALHVTHVRSLADVGPALGALREALGLEGEGKDAAFPIPAPAQRPVRVYVPIWRRPWMSISAATYASSLLEAAGAANVLAGHPDPYPLVPPEQLGALAPEVVLAPSEPYPFGARHAPLFAGVAPMVPVDGKDLFWWGARTPGALTRLRELVATIGTGCLR